jgi:starch synthase
MGALEIVMVLSEAVPFAKTGGLGDVGGALPAALVRAGHRVTVVMPRYPGVPGGTEVLRIPSQAWLGAPDARVFEQGGADGVRFRFIDCPAYYDRAGLYGTAGGDHADNDRRFAFLGRLALEMTLRLHEPVDVFHSHDWQAGLVGAYAATRYAGRPPVGSAASVFTIHNLAYQGIFPREVLPGLDLGWETFTGDGLEFWDKVSFLKAGIAYADAITTVSPSYAAEIQTEEQGFGFEGVLRHRSGVLSGILNGIDTRVWDPAHDPYLPAPYSSRDLSGKATAKAELARLAGFDGPGSMTRPIIGMVSRLVDQKGLDILAEAMPSLLQQDLAFVVLGTGEPKYEQMWRAAAAAHPERVSVTVGFSEERAHLIEGGADIFLMPSRFEPCGLNQMYSLRYGTVPLVRATGGLADTVRQVDHQTGDGTGFKFSDYSAGALTATVRYALEWYRRPEAWRRIQLAGMQDDHSWDASAREYVKVYEQALARRRQRHTLA